MSDVISWLTGKEDPSVRFFTLISLLGKPMDDPQVVESKRAIMDFGLVPSILDKQNDDGTWGDDPRRFYTDKYQGTSWVLLVLAELGADPKDSRVRRACEFILDRSQDKESAGFSHMQSEKTGWGLASGVIPCLTSNMAYSLIKLGYAEDPRLVDALDWIVRNQRADDAEDGPPIGKVYERYVMCWGRHSCHMGVAKAFKALAAIPPSLRTRQIEAKIGDLAEYFLKHHIFKMSHDLGKVAKPGWLKFGFPLMYNTDVLELLGIFAGLGIKDPRLDEAIEIVREKRASDGSWKLENSFNGKMLIDIEQKGAPSKWVTLKALCALSAYGLGI